MWQKKDVRWGEWNDLTKDWWKKLASAGPQPDCTEGWPGSEFWGVKLLHSGPGCQYKFLLLPLPSLPILQLHLDSSLGQGYQSCTPALNEPIVTLAMVWRVTIKQRKLTQVTDNTDKKGGNQWLKLAGFQENLRVTWKHRSTYFLFF